MARPTLEKNVKFKALVRLLDLPKPYVRGLLETMWDVGFESGNPALGSPAQVEAAAEWPGKPGSLFEPLRQCGFLDELRTGVWQIHDFWDHAPRYVYDRALREAQRTQKGDTISSLRAAAGRLGGLAKAKKKPKKSSKRVARGSNLPEEPSKCLANGSTPSPSPSPSPSPLSGDVSPETPLAADAPANTARRQPAERDTKQARAPRTRDLLFDAVAAVTGSDVTLRSTASFIGRTCADLRAADPPYTPEEVTRWAELVQSLPWWKGGFPAVGYLAKDIGRIRQPKLNKPKESSGYRYDQKRDG